MAIRDTETEVAGWELAIAKHWAKVANALMTDPEVQKLVSTIAFIIRRDTRGE